MNITKHIVDRQYVKWGTRGIDNKQPLTYNPIADMSNQHLSACLLTQAHMSKSIRIHMQNELKFREDNPEFRIDK